MENQGAFRTEKDYVGEKAVPARAYYGVQSLRAVENFPMTGRKLHPEFVYSLALVKKACAFSNLQSGMLSEKVANAIMMACDRVMNGAFRDQFIVDPIQGGAGTSMNMNMNEVLSNIAIEMLDGTLGDYSLVHPNDHVNNGQSTNDVIPTAGKLTVLRLLQRLENRLAHLEGVFEEKSREFDDVIKMGRTQLQDAVPVRLGQEMAAYAHSIRRALKRIKNSEKEMLTVNLGGTAVGTGINADLEYFRQVTGSLAAFSGFPFMQAEDLLDATQHVDGFLAVSGAVKAAGVAMSKIANDLRLMSSGPRTGLGEIQLPPRQNGSSIMPGKVNPVIPEVVSQAAFKAAGNDLTITMAAEAGQMELNAFEPVIFDCLFESIELIANAADTFANNCVQGIRADEKRCRELLDRSVGMAAALCPHIGYVKAAEVAKEALKRNVPLRQVVLENGYMTTQALDKILSAHEMTRPGIAGREFLKKND